MAHGDHRRVAGAQRGARMSMINPQPALRPSDLDDLHDVAPTDIATDAAWLIDQLIGLESAMTKLLTLARRVQQSRNPRLKQFGDSWYRHLRGEQVSIA